MAIKYIANNVTGDATTGPQSLTHASVMIIAQGTFTSIKFEDNVFGLGWSPVLDANTGQEIELTAPTNELVINAATNTGRAIRAIYTGAANMTIAIDEGVA